MASNRLTDFVIPSGDSKYVGLTAQQAAGKCLGRHRLILVSAVTVAVVLLIASTAWAGPNLEHPEAYVFFLIAFSITMFAAVLLNARNFNGFTGILRNDFDPQKMLDALSIVMEKRKNKKKEQGTYAMLYAQCSQQLGYDDVALQWVEHAERDLKLRVGNRLLGCNIRANIARYRGDYEELARIRGQVEALSKTNRRVGALSVQILAWIDFDLALHAGDWVRCNEAIGVMRATAVTPIQKLGCENDVARLVEAQGDLAHARELFSSIATRGGNSRAARDAAVWLEAHPAGFDDSEAEVPQS